MKEFKNTDELINHLKSKKVIIKDEEQTKIKIGWSNNYE